MTCQATTPKAYLKALPANRQAGMRQLRQRIMDHSPN